MNNYKLGTDIDKVNNEKVWLIHQITELDGFYISENIERINKTLENIVKLLR